MNTSLQAVQAITATMQTQAAFVEQVYNHSQEQHLVSSVNAILAPGGGTPPPFASTTYINTQNGNSMFSQLLGYIATTAQGVYGIGAKVFTIGNNLLDVAALLTKPDSNCFLGLAAMCQIASTLRYVGIAVGCAGLAGVIAFIIYKSVTNAQQKELAVLGAKASSSSSSVASTTPSSSSVITTKGYAKRFPPVQRKTNKKQQYIYHAVGTSEK
jgi:hypothetical protein